MRLAIFLVTILMSCAKTPTSQQLGADVAVGVVVGTLGAVASFNTDFPSGYAVELNNSRTVTTCGRSPYADTCSSGIKRGNYSACTSTNSSDTYSGTITLSFSDSACALSSSGHAVTRTYDLSRARTDFTIRTTSSNHQDYRGNTIGGGDQLTLATGDTYDLVINGRRKVATASDGVDVFDLSIRTLATVEFSQATSGTRTLSGGQIEAVHNTAKYVATFIPSNVTFASTTCCYPTGGTLAVTYAGSIEGTGTVSFDSTCGSATLTRDGQTPQVVSLTGCE